MSIVPRSDLREHELPDNVQKYRVRYLKASPWVGARPVLGTAPTVPWVVAPLSLGRGFPYLFSVSHWGRILSTLTRVQPTPAS